MSETPLFDQYSGSYDDDLNRALAVTGADKEFYAEARIRWLARCLATRHEQPKRVLDYGCGIGSATPWINQTFAPSEIVGVDVSSKSLEEARQRNNVGPVRYATISDYQPAQSLDLAFCNGVFHHIPKPERAGALSYVRNALRPKGLFAFWENNPWSPATRYVMSRCSFDKDAETLSVLEAKRLLRAAGFEILRYDFLFIFPNALRPLQFVEPALTKLPLGAQYQVLVRKP